MCNQKSLEGFKWFFGFYFFDRDTQCYRVLCRTFDTPPTPLPPPEGHRVYTFRKKRSLRVYFIFKGSQLFKRVLVGTLSGVQHKGSPRGTAEEPLRIFPQVYTLRKKNTSRVLQGSEVMVLSFQRGSSWKG